MHPEHEELLKQAFEPFLQLLRENQILRQRLHMSKRRNREDKLRLKNELNKILWLSLKKLRERS